MYFPMKISLLLISIFFLCLVNNQKNYAQQPSVNAINTYVRVADVIDNKIIYNGDNTFSQGDLVLLIQMTGNLSETPGKNAGNYELLTVKKVEGNTLYFEEIKRVYNATHHVVQLVSVPKYSDVVLTSNISAKPYDSQTGTGGVAVIYVCGKLTLQADIDVSEKGFNGANTHEADSTRRIGDIVSQGLGISPFYSNTQKQYGKSPLGGVGGGSGMQYDEKGTPLMTHCGGGGGGSVGGGGGGGGNAGGGGIAGMGGMSAMGVYKDWKSKNRSQAKNHVFIYRHKIVVDTPKVAVDKIEIAGESGDDATGLGYFNTDNNKVFMGGGGGYELDRTPQGHGGHGGGIAIVIAAEIDGNGHKIIADGGGSYHTMSCDSINSKSIDHFGGGGGGQVLIDCPKITGDLTISAKGGNSNSCQGYGGGGGGGGIWSSNELPKNVRTSVEGGEAVNLTRKPESQRGGNGLVITAGLSLAVEQVCKCNQIVACDDNNCQTKDFVNLLTCECEHTQNENTNATTDCDDNNCSTIDEFDTINCNCKHTPITTAIIVCDDKNCLTIDTYNPISCECEHKEIPKTACDDNDANTADIYNELLCKCEHLLLTTTTPSTNNGTAVANHQQVTNVTNQTAVNSETVVILLPNAFSPNDDGINDLFGIVNPDKIAEMTLLISNRWSQTVFETTDKTNKWDGSYQGNPQSVGIYLYQLKYRLTDHSDWQIQQGTVTLIR